MKRLVHITVVAVLVTLVTGCGGVHRYDARLVAADSLMWTAPDSALATLTAIDSLTGEGNLAYRDLLMTQARYKCYADITASDDSAITRAIDYYRAHSSQREKLTRAYLYKGAVMEELGRVDSAMYYYKTAEVNADAKDYINLGQINTRIADLYRRFYADNQICYDKYKQSLKYYKKIGNKKLQLMCLLSMGSCNGIMLKGDAEQLLDQATQIAIELDDSLCYYLCQELLCRQLSFKSKSIQRAKQIAMHCLKDYQPYINHDLLLDLADIYAKSGMADSARYYLNLVTLSAEMTNLEQVKTRKHLILSRITRLEGDTSLSAHFDMLAHQISDSILNSDKRYQIQEIENEFNNRQQSSILSKIDHLRWIILGLAAAAIIVITLLFIEYLRRLRNTRAIVKEFENINLSHTNDLLNLFDEHNTSIGHLITNLISILKTCANNSDERQIPTTQLAHQIKESIVDVADSGFWDELRLYLDHENDNMISRIADNPNITKKDLKLIELSCFGFSYLEIAMILDYSPRYVLNKRKIIAQKLGLQKPLLDYLNDLMTSKGE